jgi:transcriptional regulator with XRE-family HTH domain
MKTYKLLWKKLRQIRRARLDLTQLQVAKKIGISITTYNYWEKGHTHPSPENLVKLVEVFGREVYTEC